VVSDHRNRAAVYMSRCWLSNMVKLVQIQVRISLRRAAILAGSGAKAGGAAGGVPDGPLPTIGEGMKHSKSGRSLAEALSNLEQVLLPASCLWPPVLPAEE
jgi:hypothetical protein